MGISFRGGRKVLGGPLGSDTYCKLVLEAVIAKIEQDLALLNEVSMAASTN
jgi:hypothetical protein